MITHLTTTLAGMLDQLQFACKSNRGTDNAVLALLDSVTKQPMHHNEMKCQGFICIF